MITITLLFVLALSLTACARTVTTDTNAATVTTADLDELLARRSFARVDTRDTFTLLAPSCLIPVNPPAIGAPREDSAGTLLVAVRHHVADITAADTASRHTTATDTTATAITTTTTRRADHTTTATGTIINVWVLSLVTFFSLLFLMFAWKVFCTQTPIKH